MNRLDVDGWGVAQVELERSWSGRDLADKCWLFRSPSAWTLVTMRRDVRYGDDDEPVSGRATVAATVFGSLEELAEHVERIYTAGAWANVLDAGWENDAELYRAWVPERIRRDFDAASIHNKDLARYTGFFSGGPVPAPARELPGWEDDVVAQMAAHLVEFGFEVRSAGPPPRRR